MHMKKYRLMAPAGEGGEGSGEAVDRGDDWTPTDDDAPDAAAVAAAAAATAAAKTVKDKAVEKAVEKDGLKGLDATDPDPDGEADPDAEVDLAGKKKDGRIPRARHEAILAKERERRQALETQLKNFQGAQAVVQTNEEITTRETKLVTLETDFAKALADGETEKAAKLSRQMRETEREISRLENDSKMAAVEARAIEQSRYATALARVEAAYPQLDENDPDFDEEAYEDILVVVRGLRRDGWTPTDALQRAVKIKFGAKTGKQEDATTVKPKADPKDVQAALRAERGKAATDKALKAAEQPGTAVARAGMNSNDAGATKTAKDVIKMSQSDFSKLDERELARLRGDEIDG